MAITNRAIVDALKKVTKALPAAAANNNTDTIDLGSASFKPEGMELSIAIPATPSLVEAKTIICKLQDSADDSSYSDVDPLIQTTITGAALAAGGAAKTVKFRLPATTRRYIQVNTAVLADGGSNIAVSITVQLLF